MSSDTYKKDVRKIEYPGMIVRVHTPELTDNERCVRMNELVRAASAVIISANRTKKEE